MSAVTQHPDRVRDVRELTAAGDTERLADALVSVASIYHQRWDADGRRAASEVKDILDALAEPHREKLARAVVERAATAGENGRTVRRNKLVQIVSRMLPTDISVSAAESLLWLASRRATYYFWGDELAQIAKVVASAGRDLPAEVIAVMRRTTHAGTYRNQELRVRTERLTEPALNVGEAWSDQVLADLDALGEPGRALVAHAATATSAKPSAKWERRARELLDAVAGTADAGERLRGWLALVGRPRTFRLDGDAANETFDPYNTTTLRGLVWVSALLPAHPDTARVLGALVETSLRKVPGIGPRSPKIANAAVYALSRIPSEAALAQIARLAARVTYKGTLKEINAALDARAAALSLTRDEVEELAVPTYGLPEVGRRVTTFGEASAELTVTDRGTAVQWRTAAGRTVKTVPAAVRVEHADAVAELKATAKDIEKMVAAQTERLDRQFLARREWTYPVWRERLLDHQLVGTIARRLIWVVGDQAACYADGALRDVDGGPVAAGDGTTVRLWHPIGHDTADVLAWRAFLERHRITQPFKQAHREVYLLTAAEERTRVYSNRYAAHILRQHQFHALTAVRGWRNRLRLMVDDSYPPATRDLPQWGLRAEFWVEGIGDEYGIDTTDSGSFLRVATDQVRFYPVAAPDNLAHAGGGGYEQWVHQEADPTDPVPLAEVPPLVLSEVLRDVDLFVGVGSVGNDPTWQDGGPDGRFRDYWQSYSFGELSGTAETRRELLERLVPRLAIADRAHVDGRFLVVRGDIRTYRIHLGSGNILMSPNDQYLCIVPSQSSGQRSSGTARSKGATGDVFLPFEGDRVLAVILSKAMLLAKDTAITDPTITQQIRT